MNSQDLKNKIKSLPDAPGVYFFLRGKEILYIGKATSLRDRVRSYFRGDIASTRGPLISKMLSDFDKINFQKTDSVLEALILEANLIKKHQPPANIKEKDNRSFNYVIITEEDFPRVLIKRGRELEMGPHSQTLSPKGRGLKEKIDDPLSAPSLGEGERGWAGISKIFGPFPNGSQLKEALKIVRKMFPFRDKCIPFSSPSLEGAGGGRPCFSRQIGLCPGVCSGEISKKDYAKNVRNIILFFEGNKKQILKNLEKEMKELSGTREFEKAEKVKRQIFALGHIQDVALIKEGRLPREASEKGLRIESYDIAHLSGQDVVGTMTVVEDGETKKSDYRKFKIKKDPGVNDPRALSEVLDRRLNHPEWPWPDLIVVDGGLIQKNAMEKVLKNRGFQIPVVSVVKDERHKPKNILGDSKWLKFEREILLSNAEAHRFALGFHKKLRYAKMLP